MRRLTHVFILRNFHPSIIITGYTIPGSETWSSRTLPISYNIQREPGARSQKAVPFIRGGHEIMGGKGLMAILWIVAFLILAFAIFKRVELPILMCDSPH